jgi:hypothetical protein
MAVRSLLAVAALAVTVAVLAYDARAAVLRATIVVTTAADSGPGSLRQAILDANANPGQDSIVFAIPGSLPVRILVESELPTVTDSVEIDGTTQPGYMGHPVVELHGSDAVAVGLEIESDGTLVRALVVNGFGRTGINLIGADECVVEGCYLGTDVSGTVSIGNGFAGVSAQSSDRVRIGGTTLAARNVISGNGGGAPFGGGVVLETSDFCIVAGNLIGTDATGERPLANVGPGISCRTTSATIGGVEAGAGNTIAYNEGSGVQSNYVVTILSNAIFENGGPPIEYTGPQIAPPVLTFVGPEDGGTRIEGGIAQALHPDSPPYRIEVYRNRDCSGASGCAMREIVLAIDVAVDLNGVVWFSELLPITLCADETLSATATFDGKTSTVSVCGADTRGCRMPFVTMYPVEANIPSGTTRLLSVEVTGTGPLTYQWYRTGVGGPTLIPGATSSEYSPPPVVERSTFRVDVTGPCGQTSANAVLSVCHEAPTARSRTPDMTIESGSAATIGVDLFGAVSHQWYEGVRGDTSTPVGSSSDTFQTPALYRTTSYWARGTNGCGSADSETITLTVIPGIEITSVVVKTSASGRSKLVAKGARIGPAVDIRIAGVGFERRAKVNGTKIVQAGALADGRSLDEAIPPGATVALLFITQDHGRFVFVYTRPQ